MAFVTNKKNIDLVNEMLALDYLRIMLSTCTLTTVHVQSVQSRYMLFKERKQMFTVIFTPMQCLL